MTTHLPTPDSYWVTRPSRPTGRLLAGEYPGAKDPEEARRKLGRFLDAGVTNFIDLTEESEGNLRAYASEMAALGAARGVGVEHHRLSIRDLDVPAAQHLSAILDAIDEALAKDKTVYVHCYGGIGRTGTVIGCWLVRHGLSADEALSQIAAWRAGTPDGWITSPETTAQRAMVSRWHEVENL